MPQVECTKRNPTDRAKRYKSHHPHEEYALTLLDSMVTDNVFDDCVRLRDLDQMGIDFVTINHFPRGFGTSQRTREFRMFIQHKSSPEDALSFTNSNPCVIPWVVTKGVVALQAKIDLLRTIVDWLILHGNHHATNFFRDQLVRYETIYYK